MRALPADAIFDRAQARAIGWSDSAITRAIRSGRLHALRHGQLTAEPLSDDRTFAVRTRNEITLATAASRACQGSVVSHRSAALIHDLAVGNRRATAPGTAAVPTLTVSPRGKSVAAQAELHRATLFDEDVTDVGGVAVTTVARTVVDIARFAPTWATVITVDSALHKGLTTFDELQDVVLSCRTWPGIRRARRAIALGDSKAESALESISQLVLRWIRLPTPLLQPDILAPGGRFIGRVDFYWDEFGVAGEADGADKYSLSPTSLLDEKRRQEALESLGLVVVRWGSDNTRTPELLRSRILSAFERGQARDRSGLCRKWSVRGTESGHLLHKPG